MFQDRSVARKTAIILCIVLAAVFFGKLFLDIYTDRARVIGNAEQRAMGLASALNEHALRTFNGAEATIDTMIRDIDALSASGVPKEGKLKQLLAANRAPGSVLSTLFIASPAGKLHAISTEYPVRSITVSDREYFRHHLTSSDGNLFISRPFRNRLDNDWLITATKRLSNPDGSLRMIVGVSIRTKYFSSFYSTLQLGHQDRILLVRQDGTILSLQPFSDQTLQANLSASRLFLRELRTAPESGTFQEASAPLDGTKRIVSYRCSATYPVIAIISLDQKNELRQWRARAIKELAGAGLLLALVTLLSCLIWRQVTHLKSVNQRLLAQQSELTEAKRRSLESEQRFRQLLENIQLVSVILDRDGTILFCNDYLLQLSGWSREEALGTNWFEMFLPADNGPQVRAMFEQGVARADIPAHHENPIVTRDGELRSISWDNTVLHDPDGSVAAIASIGTDMTQHRALEEQLRQSQKMEATGLLAGGIAHDFNNILTVIIGYCSVMQMHMAPDDSNSACVNHVLAAAERAAGLTRSLLAFSRKQVMNPRQVDLNAIVRHVEHFLCRVIGEDISLNAHLHHHPLNVLADSGQIEQILMNLATNARDAMPDGGSLTVSTEMVELDPGQVGFSWCTRGCYALLTFSDNGTGMDDRTRTKIFEPFFTTKEVGKGTGLGLAMAYGIVMQHNGQILVESEPDTGTTFKIYLPMMSCQIPEAKPDVSRFEAASGNELILVAEDEPAVREMVQGILAEFGYRVLLARDGAEAVEQFRARQEEVDLVLLDLIMPKLSGKAAYDDILRMKPGIKVIFTSGYTADVIRSKGELRPGTELVMKPVHPMVLLKKVRELLDRP